MNQYMHRNHPDLWDPGNVWGDDGGPHRVAEEQRDVSLDAWCVGVRYEDPKDGNDGDSHIVLRSTPMPQPHDDGEAFVCEVSDPLASSPDLRVLRDACNQLDWLKHDWIDLGGGWRLPSATEIPRLRLVGSLLYDGNHNGWCDATENLCVDSDRQYVPAPFQRTNGWEIHPIRQIMPFLTAPRASVRVVDSDPVNKRIMLEFPFPRPSNVITGNTRVFAVVTVQTPVPVRTRLSGTGNYTYELFVQHAGGWSEIGAAAAAGGGWWIEYEENGVDASCAAPSFVLGFRATDDVSPLRLKLQLPL